jgi:hypothetical protein
LDQSTSNRDLDRAFDELEREVPNGIARTIRWLRNPKAHLVRIPLGIVLVVLSFFSFLPVIGIEFLPIGLAVIAIDVPFLRKPISAFMLWVMRKWRGIRQWWQVRRSSRG